MNSSSSGFQQHVERFGTLLPKVFSKRQEDWQREDWIDVGSDEFDVGFDWIDPWTERPEPLLDRNAPEDRQRIGRLIDLIDSYVGERRLIRDSGELGNLVGPPKRLVGDYPGAPVDIKGVWEIGSPPPPDAIAFCVPAHFFPYTAGIYFILENWLTFCLDLAIRARSLGHHASAKDLLEVSTRYLYAHEYYHHKVEMFGFRWEAQSRTRFYCSIIRRLYRLEPAGPDPLEEALATAFGVAATARSVRERRLPEVMLEALKNYLQATPPHYRRGLELDTHEKFTAAENRFLERAGMLANPHKFALGMEDLWIASTYRLAGSIRPGSPFTFLVNRRSTLLAKLRLGLRAMRVRELKRVLQDRGYKFLRQGANHEIWESPTGKPLAIPRHPRDIRAGLMHRICKECGIN